MAIIAHARRRTAARGPRFAACAALALAGALAGGGVGFLLGFFAFLLFLDAVIPLPGGTWNEAEDHFRRLQRQRRYARGRLRRPAAARLEVLDDRSGWASVAERRELGVLEIPLESVSGTVEELKAATFDPAFRPDRSAAEHWKRLWLAQTHGAVLPPIAVYRVGDRHFVRDGHHRVSVARDLGYATIEAEVVVLERRS
jgi:hypothetical protein